MRSERFRKLPRWAQAEITDLEERVSRQVTLADAAEAKLMRFVGEADATTLVRIMGFGPDKDIPLTEEATIRFKIGSERADYVMVSLEYGTVGPKDNRREEIVGVVVSTGRCLKVIPRANNSILIASDR